MKLKSFLLLLFLALYSLNAVGGCHKQTRIAIIDTGLDLQDPRFQNHLCKTGHKNFLPDEGRWDINGHGTHVAGLIKQYAGDADYCILVYRFYSEQDPGKHNLDREILSIKEAIKNKATIINLSEGGPEFIEEEYLLIKNHPKITFVMAAGNDGKNLDIPGNEYYPGSYFLPNEKVVSSMGNNSMRSDFSNFSMKSEWEIGENVKSTLPFGRMGYMSGTSQAAAIFSGKLVDRLSRTCEYK